MYIVRTHLFPVFWIWLGKASSVRPISMDITFCHNKNLQVIIIHIKIDTIQYINITAKNVKGKHPQLQWQG